MLSVRAESFRQKSMLAISLSWIGGYVNIVLFLTCGAFVSHMTGNSTLFATAVERGDVHGIVWFGALIACFWVGALVSGLMTQQAARMGARSKYVLPMATEAALLSILAAMMKYHVYAHASPGWLMNAMVCLSAAAMGLQNATITEISGEVIRTTHLTGVLTDLGLECARYTRWYWERFRALSALRHRRLIVLSRRHAGAQRLVLLACVLASFLFGATAGAWVSMRHAGVALLAPVAFLLVVILKSWTNRKAIAADVTAPRAVVVN